jgi:HK97 gp10 family phage protein
MISFKVTSRNRIPDIVQALRPRAGRAINTWARNVLDLAQQLAPYKTGKLRRSGKIVNYAGTVGDGRQNGVAKSVVFTAPHARFVHDGTAHMTGTPFLLTAFEVNRQQLLDDLAAIVKL